MEQSAFMDKGHAPDSSELSATLGKCYPFWNEVTQLIFKLDPSASEEWNFSKLGWNCRIKDKKRIIVYLMPGDNCFRASFVLGRKAVEEAMSGGLSDETKAIINESKVYAEGTGIRVIVKNKKTATDVRSLVSIKFKY